MTEKELIDFVENYVVNAGWCEHEIWGQQWVVEYIFLHEECPTGRGRTFATQGDTFREAVEKAKREFDRIAAEMV